MGTSARHTRRLPIWRGVSGLDPYPLNAIIFRARNGAVRSAAVVVAQSVRAPDCGSGGCGFKSRQPPWLVHERLGPGAEVRSSIGRAPVSKTGGWGFDSLRACWSNTALSSRGLGRGPLKAQTRVRIPLALCRARGERPHRLSVRTRPFQGRERGSTPLGAMIEARAASSIGRASDS
jgi:hypothetical protein